MHFLAHSAAPHPLAAQILAQPPTFVPDSARLSTPSTPAPACSAVTYPPVAASNSSGVKTSIISANVTTAPQLLPFSYTISHSRRWPSVANMHSREQNASPHNAHSPEVGVLHLSHFFCNDLRLMLAAFGANSMKFFP